MMANSKLTWLTEVTLVPITRGKNIVLRDTTVSFTMYPGQKFLLLTKVGPAYTTAYLISLNNVWGH